MTKRLRNKGDSGSYLWHDKVRGNYLSLDELAHFDSIYGVATRCGYDSPEALWRANPMLQGSTNPDDFGVALYVTLRPRTADEAEDSLWDSSPWILEHGDGVRTGYETKPKAEKAMTKL